MDVERLPAAVQWFVRDPDTGEVVMNQPPNAPILLFYGASAGRLVARSREPWATGFQMAASAALMYWAADEILTGQSPYRRTLGVLGVAWTVGQAVRALR